MQIGNYKQPLTWNYKGSDKQHKNLEILVERFVRKIDERPNTNNISQSSEK